MAYKFYLNKMLFPVAPSKLELKTKNQNKTMVLMNDGEINMLKQAGLTNISFDLLLPNVLYPFADYEEDEFKPAGYFLKELERLKVEQKPFMFYVERPLPNGKLLFETNMKVSLEDYTIKENANQGFDVVVAVKLKQYKDYGTKLVKVSENNTATVETQRETSNSPEPNKSTTYTVKNGDTLWAIAKAAYGDGSKYTVIFDANKDIISNPSLIYPGQVITLPGSVGGVITTSGTHSGGGSVSGSSNGSASTPKSEAVKVNIFYSGIDPGLFGVVAVQYIRDGKYYNKTYSKGAAIEVDKGSWVTIRPESMKKTLHGALHSSLSTPGWEKHLAMGVDEWQRIADTDCSICIWWVNTTSSGG